MNDYTQLINSINQTIKKNGNKEITGDILNAILKLIADYSKNNFENIRDVIQNIANDENIGIIGSISPNDILNNLPDGFYLPTTAGTYTNMGGLVVKEGYFTIISKLNTTYSIASEVKMPTLSPTGVVEEGNTEAVSGGEVYLRGVLNWRSAETGLKYPTVRTHEGLVYRVKEGGISTNFNPNEDVDNWEELGYTPSNGIASDGSASININTANDTISFSGTFAVVGQRRRIVMNANQTINLLNNAIGILYIDKDGNILTTNISMTSSVPKDALIFATYRKITPDVYVVSGLRNYLIDGYSIINIKNVRYGIIDGSGIRNFDLVNNKLIISSTNIVVTTDGDRLIVAPQAQEVDLATSGTYVMYFDKDSILKTIVQSSVSNIPNGSIIIGTYTRASSNVVYVNGIDRYNINNVPINYIGKGIGKLVSFDGAIDVNDRTLTISNTTILLIGQTRYSIPSQSIEFSASASIFYFSPSNNTIGSTVTSSIVMPADAIVFGGHVGSKKGRRFELWGIENYTINNQPKDYLYKLIQKKIITDYDPTQHYYKCETDVSMTNTDAEPLVGSDSKMMNDKYDALMTEYSSLISKETIATITTSLGNRDINVYTFTPPTINTNESPTTTFFTKEVPHVLIVCSQHGSEKTASMACYLFLKDILERWQDDKVLEWFRFNVKLSIIPVANPAGWINNTRVNGNGVDMNRNYPHQYIANYNPGKNTWSSLSALDQQETYAINNWIETNKNNLLLGIDFHNFFGYSLHPEEASAGWTEAPSPFLAELGRVAAQRFSRNSRDSSVYFPSDYNKMLMASSYVTNAIGKLSGQINNVARYGVTFEVNQNFTFNPDWKAGDNESLKIATEVFGNSLSVFLWHCIQDFNQKNNLIS